MSLTIVYLYKINQARERYSLPKQSRTWDSLDHRLNIVLTRLDTDSDDFHISWVEQRALPAIDISGASKIVKYFKHYEAFCRADLKNKLIFYSGPRGSYSTVQHWIWNQGAIPIVSACDMDLRTVFSRENMLEFIISEIRSIVIDNLAIEKVSNATLSARFVDLIACQSLITSPNSVIRSATVTSRRNINARIQLKSDGVVRLSRSCGETWAERIDFLETLFGDIGLWS